MRRLSAQDLVDLWEWGQGKSPARRALGVLTAALPDSPVGELETLTVGGRNRRLLAVREALFGPTLACLTDCPSCREPVELRLDAPALAVEADGSGRGDEGAGPRTLSAGGIEVRWRSPAAVDLLALEAASDVEEARALLLRSVVVDARRGEEQVPPEALPESVLGALSEAIDRADPLARPECGLVCPECGHRWEALLDVADFLWTEVETVARRLLGEVHALASAYGWGEGEILALPQHRRRAYLEMLGA